MENPPMPHCHDDAFVAFDAFASLVEGFAHDRVKFLIAGGMAVIAHGYLHFTSGIDVVIDQAIDNEQRAMATLEALGYRAGNPTPGQSIRFILVKEESEVQVLPQPSHDFDRVFSSALLVTLGGSQDPRIPFIGWNDLIAMKRESGRPSDLHDIQELTLQRDWRPDAKPNPEYYRIQQRLGEASWPFWKKLRTLESLSRFAMHLKHAQPVDPPDWVLAQRKGKEGSTHQP